VLVPAAASREVAPAQCFIAMHWGEEFMSGSSSTGNPLAGVNALTSPAYCPSSKQPELKHAAVKVLKAELPWRLLGVAWFDEAAALRAREALRPLMAGFAFAACVPFGRDRSGVLFRAAANDPAPAELVQRVESILGLAESDALHYADPRRGQRRSMRLARSGTQTRLDGFLLAGDIRAEAWIKALLIDGLPAQSYGRLLLAPGAKPPVAVQPRGRQVCSCLDIGQAQIDETLARCEGPPDDMLAQLQSRLKCGTQCGSCIPELKRLVRSRLMPA
jgi:assimilatory nitrate reductase catalytic subunit